MARFGPTCNPYGSAARNFAPLCLRDRGTPLLKKAGRAGSRFDTVAALCYTGKETAFCASRRGRGRTPPPSRRGRAAMPSFELIYEEDEDVLEATFEVFDEHFARAIPLNDAILLHTDLSLSVAWGITFYNYTRLLQVSETHLDGLRPLPEADARRVLNLLSLPPIVSFLELLDPGDLRALVKAPHLQDLLPEPV